MKAYVITTGLVFGLLTVAHLWRIIVEKPVATNPIYLLITSLSAALFVWALWLLRRSRA